MQDSEPVHMTKMKDSQTLDIPSQNQKTDDSSDRVVHKDEDHSPKSYTEEEDKKPSDLGSDGL